MANIEYEYLPAANGETERLTFSSLGEVVGELRGGCAELVMAIIQKKQLAAIDQLEVTKIIRDGFYAPKPIEQIGEDVWRAMRGRSS